MASKADEAVRSEETIISFLVPLTQGSPGALALKDDCALLTPVPGTELVLKTDPVAEGVHFLPGDPPEDIAWKALAVNVSDLAAKGATPLCYLMALSFPEAPSVRWMKRFVDGMHAAQVRFGCYLIGGDTDRRPGPLTISVTAIGSVPLGGMVTRTTARAGDALFLSGTIGDAAVGLELLKDPDLKAAWGLSDSEADYLRQSYRRPQPRLTLATALRRYASAAMDVSDGLVKDLERMASASGVAGHLAAAAIPLSGPARKIVTQAPDRLSWLITAGDDYEVLAAVPQARATDFATAAASAGTPVTRIGEMLPGPPALTIAGPDGRALAIPERTGWDHFRCGIP